MTDDDHPYRAPAGDDERLTADEASYARRRTRLMAHLIDLLLCLIAFLPVMLTVPLGGDVDAALAAAAASPDAAVSLVLVAALAVVDLVLLARRGQTVGKLLCRVRIVRSDCRRVGLGRLIALRILVPGLAGAVPLVGLLFAVVDALFIVRADRRCLHDLIADTCVIEVRGRGRAQVV